MNDCLSKIKALPEQIGNLRTTVEYD